jgi:hypothetical protein
VQTTLNSKQTLNNSVAQMKQQLSQLNSSFLNQVSNMNLVWSSIGDGSPYTTNVRKSWLRNPTIPSFNVIFNGTYHATGQCRIWPIDRTYDEYWKCAIFVNRAGSSIRLYSSVSCAAPVGGDCTVPLSWAGPLQSGDILTLQYMVFGTSSNSFNVGNDDNGGNRIDIVLLRPMVSSAGTTNYM